MVLDIISCDVLCQRYDQLHVAHVMHVYIAILMAFPGMQGLLTLSSMPASENGYIVVCPHTNITLTCSGTHIQDLTWLDQNRQIATIAVGAEAFQYQPPYSITVVEENVTDFFADLTTTLALNVDDIQNGTNITCRTVAVSHHLLLYEKGIYMYTCFCCVYPTVTVVSYCVSLHHHSLMFSIIYSLNFIT